MILEFRVKNFRSIRDEQVLSLVASKDSTLQEKNTKKTGLKSVPRVLRSAVLYGGNASGKSNLIRALQYMRGMVTESATKVQPGQEFKVRPFLLDEETLDQPTEFEISFLVGATRYQYAFSMTSQRIIDEQLLVYRTSKPQHWFTRTYDAELQKYSYVFGAGLKGAKSIWENATRPNSLFLSMAVLLNSELLQPIYSWFEDSLVVLNEHQTINQQFSVGRLKSPEGRRELCNFLDAADISISDIEVQTEVVSGHTINFDTSTGATKMSDEPIEQNVLLFHHKSETAEAVFKLEDESSGTRRMLFLGGPLLDILDKGKVLIVDELDSSLHPKLVREVVALFHHQGTSDKGAQLIFSTHGTSLLDAVGLFRRDQIWFVDKGRDQASTLTPLTEYSPRKSEALEKGYLSGRYAGSPFVLERLGRPD